MKKQTNLMLEPQSHQRLKMASVMGGRTMGDTVKHLLDKCFPLDARQQLSLSVIEADEMLEADEEAKKCL